MFTTLRQAGLLWPTLLTIAALIVLIALGNWQWQRKIWKEGLIKQLAFSVKAKPKPLSEIDLGEKPEQLRFQRVRVVGSFSGKGRSIDEVHVWTPGKSGPGWRVISPFVLDQPIKVGGHVRSWGLVIRGRVSQADKPIAKRAGGRAAGQRNIVGRIRLGATNWATPEPNLKANEWYALDLESMLATFQKRGEAGNAKLGKPSSALPFFIEAEKALAAAPAPQPDLQSVYLSNRHLEYAVTWWGLALTLVAVYLAFVRSRLTGRRSG